MTKRDKRQVFSLVEAILAICALLIGLSIFVPVYIHKYKIQKIEKDFYENTIMDQELYSNVYKNFWKKYDKVLKVKADSDKNKHISVQERETFDKQFFGNLNLTVDPKTKNIKKVDDSYANPDALTCYLNNFYPDKPWIKPVCPDL